MGKVVLPCVLIHNLYYTFIYYSEEIWFLIFQNVWTENMDLAVSNHCQQDTQCHNVNGSCLQGCSPGYIGPFCNISKWLYIIHFYE